MDRLDPSIRESREPDGEGASAALDRLVRRLVAASERPKLGWQGALAQHGWEQDWSGVFRGLPAWDPLRRAPHLEGDLAGGTTGLHRALAYFQAGVGLESILRAGLAELAAGFPAGHPVRCYIAWELLEEAQHSAMFEWFCDLAGPDLVRHPVTTERDVRRIAVLGREMPAVFLLYAVLGEMAFDKVQRASLSSVEVPPLVAEVHRIHCSEEARHLSFGRALLRHHLKSATPRLKRRLTYEAPMVARWTCDLVMDLPRSLHVALSATDDEIVAARRAARRSEIYRECFADQRRFLQSLDLVDPRLDGSWDPRRLADAV